MRRALVVTGLVLLAACSSSHKTSDSTDTSTTTTPASTSTGSRTTVPSTAPATAPTTSPPPTTNGGGSNSSVTVNGFSYSGPSPIECNAPTQIELKWTASGATDVALSIDGASPIAHYANGARDELLPLACDGKSHTYTLTATAPGVHVTRSITLQTKTIA